MSFFVLYFLNMCNISVYAGPWWTHVRQYWDHKNDENILFLKYEDTNKVCVTYHCLCFPAVYCLLCTCISVNNHIVIFKGILLASQILVALMVSDSFQRVVLPITVYTQQREKICIWSIRLRHTKTSLLSYRKSSLVASSDIIHSNKRIIHALTRLC